MAYTTTQIVLGFPADKFHLLHALGLNVERYELGDLGELHEKVHQAHQDVHLEWIFKHILSDLGFTAEIKGNTIEATTPAGEKFIFRPSWLQLYFDPYELAQDDDDAVIGIPFDIRFGSADPGFNFDSDSSLIRLTPGLMGLMDKFKASLVRAIPLFEDAEWIITQMFH
ncbi:MAG: hypothetical protein NTW50_04195 [Candidatus Berkelbacteria bacterium]|nr:hypothetical protein [Candidatus Berkelbacteria bacterium]